MNYTPYDKKFKEILSDDIYKPIHTDLTTYLEKNRITEILDIPIYQETGKLLIPREYNQYNQQ